MKNCSICKTDKDESDFGVRKGNKLQQYCRECQRQYSKEHYLKNKQKYLNKAKKRNKNLTEENRIIIDKYRTKCLVCGETEKCCLDFHHIDDKDFCISRGLHYSTNRLIQEIMKCVVLCSNCHRKVHNNIVTSVHKLVLRS